MLISKIKKNVNFPNTTIKVLIWPGNKFVRIMSSFS